MGASLSSVRALNVTFYLQSNVESDPVKQSAQGIGVVLLVSWLASSGSSSDPRNFGRVVPHSEPTYIAILNFNYRDQNAEGIGIHFFRYHSAVGMKLNRSLMA